MRVFRVLEQRNAVVYEKQGKFCHRTADGGEMCHATKAEAEAMVSRLSHARALKAGRDGQVKTAQFQGRDHLVVPVVALVEGVIQASNASIPELVLAEEFERNVAGWNGRPVMLNHPTWGNGPVAANDPRVLDESQIGTVFNARVEDGKLKMDAYVDPARLETMGEPGAKMLASIRAGEMLEVSVGTVVEATPENGKVGGKPYAAVWRDINSDHLAFLPEGVKGACSVEMGCGTRVAEEAEKKARAAGCGCGGQGSHHASAEDGSMDKKARVAALIASGKTCFKAADAAVLEQLSDEAIVDMETKLAAFPPKKDETPEEKKKRMEEEKAKYMAEVLENPNIKALVDASKLTPEQRKEAFLKENTDIAEIVTSHKAATAARRAELVGKLKVAQTAYKEDELQALPSDQLEKLASIVVKEKPNYEGQIPRAAAQGDEGEVPPAPSMKARILEMRGLKAQA